MAEMKLADGTLIKELRVFNGSQWVARQGKLYDGSQWVGLIKPLPSFRDDLITYTGLIRDTNTGLVQGGVLMFDTLVSYSVK